MYFCGLQYIEDGLTLTEPDPEAPAARYHTIEENIQILEEEDVEFISVPVPEFADSDPADIVHDFHRVRNDSWESLKAFTHRTWNHLFHRHLIHLLSSDIFMNYSLLIRKQELQHVIAN